MSEDLLEFSGKGDQKSDAAQRALLAGEKMTLHLSSGHLG